MKETVSKLFPHLLVLLFFCGISLAYFSPVLQGKKIFQSDIVQYTGMAKQHNDFRAETGEETYWTNSAFGGMPTYQLGAHYPHNYIKKLDHTIRFLPRPADYLFLYFLGFYILLLSLKMDFKLATLGALAFGFSTYLIIILGVGHNAKAHAIAYMPMVLAGIFLVFRKKYLLGFFVTCIAMALEISANHFQMTYYLLLLILVIGIVFLIDSFKKKTLPHYFKSVGIMAGGVVIAIGLNATNILATQEYAKESTRGATALTIQPDGSPKEVKSGLSREYITEYSYGIVESFNLFIPRFMGGGNTEDVGTNSASYDLLMKMGVTPAQAKDFVKAIPTYWGDQPIVAAPAYIGSIVLFLALLGIFLLRGKHRQWLIAGSVMALLLSWGKNFESLTNLFIDYFPLYDKFRAVSSIQVIIELCMPVLAIFGIYKVVSSKLTKEEKTNALKYSTLILSSLCILLLVFHNSLFDFEGYFEQNNIFRYQPVFRDLVYDFMDAVREDRKSIFVKDTLRSLAFVLASAVLLWLFLKEKLKRNTLYVSIGLLFLLDLVPVDRRYVNNENFVAARQVTQPFPETPADKDVAQDESHYRVYDLTTNPFSSGRASFFHNALGGYHAAKPARVQDLYDFYMQKGKLEVFNMFNVKYFFEQDEEGRVMASVNPAANGNAWFVKEAVMVETADEELLSLDTLNTKQTAVIHKEFQTQINQNKFVIDSTASIKLVEAQPNYMYYETENENQGLAVFSELYYPYGWKVYINDKPVEQFRANYALRALVVPGGFNKIEFKFEPEVVQKGSSIALASSVLLLLLLLGGILFGIKSKADKEISEDTKEV
ncbi:MAG: hypothetical protein NXH73_10020 [Flavobacteriaceae bacterium]|nr:hypothetical protein [Flavobacteriaceae bacterium]